MFWSPFDQLFQRVTNDRARSLLGYVLGCRTLRYLSNRPLPSPASPSSWQETFAHDIAQARATLADLLQQIDARRSRGTPTANLTPSAQRHEKIGVILVGLHSDDWMTALCPASPVWALLPEVAQVDLLADHPQEVLVKHQKAGLHSVVIPLLEQHHHGLGSDIPGFFPQPDVLELLGDKLLFGLFLQAFAPELAPPFYTDCTAPKFPCVAKCARLNGGHGVQLVEDEAMLAEFMQNPHWQNWPKLLQGAVPGRTDYVTHAICRPGEVIWHDTYEYHLPDRLTIRGPDVNNAKTPCATSPKMLDFLTRLSARLGYEGPLNVDYKMTFDGPCVFEINPRLGGSLMVPESLAARAAALRCLIDQTLARPKKDSA